MYLICNHKNKLTYKEVKEYTKKLKNIKVDNLNLIIAPSLPYIYNFIEYELASQDISVYDCDTITGDITGRQLRSLSVKYVIIGHPERRKKYYETIDILKRKIINANNNNIKVIYCFTDNGSSIEETKNSLESEYFSIKDVLKDDAIIAYEPFFAIGGSNKLDYEYTNEIINYLSKITNKNTIYGGGVDEINIEKLLKFENIDGFLISNSSLDITVLQKIIKKLT